ncbi:MAG: tetratricopeptide repeat protein, partial [Phycisphaeraceae bacterium]
MIATLACRLLRVSLLCLATMALAAMWSCDRGGDASSAGTETNRGDAASESRSGEGSNGSGSSTTTDPDAISAADTQLGHLQQRFLQMQQRGEALGPLRVRVERFVSEHPEHPDARMLLAQVYLQQGDAEAASESLERAIELRPEVPAWRDMAATLAMQRGEYNTAERHLRAAIDMQPSDAMLRVRLAQVCLATDRLEQAENLLHAVLDLDASRHEAHHLLAAVARQRGRFVDARTHSRRAIELVRGEDEKSHRARRTYKVMLARGLRQENRPEDALDVLRSIEPVEQRAHREVLELQAQCHADLGRPEAAANVYEQLLIVQPGHRAFAEKAFRWRLQAGQIDRARELLRYARRNFPASETTRAMAAAM